RHLCRGASDREARLGAPSADAYYGENDRPLGITQGVLTQALTVDFTRSFHDTVQCATFTELTAASHAHPYVIHTRMEATEEGQVTTMESVVTDADDWVFGADAHLAQTRVENWGEIPEDRRDRRGVLRRRPTPTSTTGGTRTCRCRTVRRVPGSREIGRDTSELQSRENLVCRL